MIGSAWKALRVAALAVLAAGCGEPRGSSLEPRGKARCALPRGSPIWAGEQKLAASDSAELDQFGYAVALTPDRAIVGAYGENSYRGAAYVFVKSGSSWTEEQKLVASDGAEGDNFGWSVALNTDRAIVGAYGENSYRGAGYVFVKIGNIWSEEQKLVATDGAELDQLSYSVSLTEDTALLGAPGNDSYRGAAYAFVKSGSSWIEKQKLLVNNGSADDHFGDSVAVGVDRALVGAPGQDNSRGAVYGFANRGGSWTEEQRLLASDGSERDHFGNSVSLSAGRALVGAYWDDDFRGAAYVFVDSDGAWGEQQKLVASDGVGGDRFGNSLSLNADRALIGAVGYDSNRGAAYVFAREGSSWAEAQKLVASDGVSPDLFSWSVSLADNRALVGANYTDELRGSAYAFSLGLADGDLCLADADCASSHCADGYCCNMGCGPFACQEQSAECTRCESDHDCPEALYCAADQSCQARRKQGEACDGRAGQDCLLPGCRSCQSGFCADGVCCNASCADLCEACTAKLTGDGDDGDCRPIAAGTDPEDECSDDGVTTCETNGRCDGARACQRYQSRTSCEPEPCARGDECTSGHCEDGLCCDRACAASERCRADLKLSGGDGSCGPARAAALGEACNFGVQCTSGYCVNGACCDATCGSDRAVSEKAGCGCRMGRAPGHARDFWLGAALWLLLRRWRRGTRRAAGLTGMQSR